MKPVLPTQFTTPEHHAPRRQPKPAGPSFAFGAVLLFALLAVPFLMRVLASVPVS
jgi:hypothetical protein